jgi:hypothetical protein
MRSVASAYGSRNAQQQAAIRAVANSKWQSAEYYDRVSRGVYVHSGFEPHKFDRTGATSLANLNFSNLKQRRYGFLWTRNSP